MTGSISAPEGGTPEDQVPERSPTPVDRPASDAEPREHIPERVKEDKRPSRRITSAWSGPLPSPESLKAFNDILPGSAERILAMTERQAAHRQAMESRALGIEETSVQGATTIIKRGQIFALIVVLAVLAFGIVATTLGMSGVAIAAIITALLTGVAIFITVKKNEQDQDKLTEDKGGNELIDPPQDPKSNQK